MRFVTAYHPPVFAAYASSLISILYAPVWGCILHCLFVIQSQYLWFSLARQCDVMDNSIPNLLCQARYFGINAMVNAVDLGSGLVAHWPFDEGTGTTARDASGNGTNAIIINGNWTLGPDGVRQAVRLTYYTLVQFTGVTNLIPVGNAAYSISVWVKKPTVHWCYVIFWGEEHPNQVSGLLICILAYMFSLQTRLSVFARVPLLQCTFQGYMAHTTHYLTGDRGSLEPRRLQACVVGGDNKPLVAPAGHQMAPPGHAIRR